MRERIQGFPLCNGFLTLHYSPLKVKLHPAILPIDPSADLRHAIALLHHPRRIQRLSLTDVHSGCGMTINEAREKGAVPHVLIAIAVAIELIEDFWNLLGHLISHRRLTDK